MDGMDACEWNAGLTIVQRVDTCCELDQMFRMMRHTMRAAFNLLRWRGRRKMIRSN